MDYAIFLLHRFAEFRDEGLDVKEAMVNAMKSLIHLYYQADLQLYLDS